MKYENLLIKLKNTFPFELIVRAFNDKTAHDYTLLSDISLDDRLKNIEAIAMLKEYSALPENRYFGCSNSVIEIYLETENSGIYQNHPSLILHMPTHEEILCQQSEKGSDLKRSIRSY